SIELELPRADAPPLPVRASRAGIAQILLNLAVNARDAMPEGGAFGIAVHGRDGEAVLRARDTGRGVPPEIRDRIFDPFFTTKPLGEGTGLGLATVYGLVRQFGGTIAVSAGEPIGTTFEIVLPLAGPRVAAPPEQRATAAAPPIRAQPGAPARRVLVAEDEPPIARVARRILERAGYDVTVEGDGRAALERLRRGDRFDVVLTDAAMPVMSGWQLADEIARLPSPPPVVLMSGYAEHSADAGRRGGDPTARPAGFLQKPFTNVELLAAVERVTARGGG
ncbi:MAG TPA: ATP-binding protein, partial [Anaeromyxobacteraceae bacterium]|nr:ATP-binding protein [Anaeromyxobacteraceae bacterium]